MDLQLLQEPGMHAPLIISDLCACIVDFLCVFWCVVVVNFNISATT